MTATETTTESRARTGSSGSPVRLPRYVDWLVAGVLALLGAALVFGGGSLVALADVTAIRELVEAGTIRSDVLGDRALVDATYGLLRWGGIGLVATGVATWLGTVGYLAYRRRETARQETLGATERGPLTNAVVGAVASVVLSTVPFSPVLGGALAGYLQRGGRRVDTETGALSGLLAVLPLVAAVTVLVGGTVAEVAWALDAVDAVVLAGLLGVGVLFTVLLSVALGALGGLLGGRIAAR
jgi:hypothetical protein